MYLLYRYIGRLHDTRPAGIHPPSPPKELLPAAESEKGWAEYFMGHKVALHGRGRWVLVLDEEVVDATLTSRVSRVAPVKLFGPKPPMDRFDKTIILSF